MNPPGDAGDAVTIVRAPGGFVLTCSQWLPRPLATVFPFFADARNLERLTPPFLKFRVLSTSTPGVERGTLIRYTLRLHGVPIPWTSRIDVWEPPHQFVDLQLRGPYRRWHHTHQFAAENAGTRVNDRVEFALPFGFLHHTPVAALIQRDVQRIFAYRQDTLARHFAAEPTPV